METNRFDRLTRAFSHLLSRRAIASGLGIAVVGLSGLTEAKKKRRKKKKKIKKNQFGCVNVGNFCKNSGQCCSGICEGKKGKKKCRAHNVDVCEVGQDSCDENAIVFCSILAVNDGFCFTTTGNAPYCGAAGGVCFDCNKDADCIESCGAGAACVLCPSCQEGGEFVTACIGADQACVL